MAKASTLTQGKDFLGNTLAVGDFVAFSQSDSSDLNFGQIEGFTPKMVRVALIRTESNRQKRWVREVGNRSVRQIVLVCKAGDMEGFEGIPRSFLAAMLG